MLQTSAVERLFQAVGQSLIPPDDLIYSEWASQNYRLAADSSASPGRFHPWKPQRGILDAIGDETIERVSVIKAARVGYTVSLSAALGAITVNDPGNIIVLVPTDDDARGIITDDILPHFKASPALKDVFLTGRYDGRNTLTQKMLRGGGSLKILSAVAPRKLRRHTARYLFCDEVDGMEVTKEGDPIKLAEKRTQSFSNRKIVAGSTPTDEATSLIIKRYNESDKRVFEVSCSHCFERFELQWEMLDWKPGLPETVVLVPPCCGAEINENRKPEMVENGEWRATAPEVKGHAGFRLSALTSMFTNAAWPVLVLEYENAKKAGHADLQVFWNTVLGRVWSQAVDYVPESELMQRRQPFGIQWQDEKSRWREDIPADVAYLTCGVDVQPSRYEATIFGFSPDNVYVLGHHVIRGDIRLKTTQDDLYAFLSTRWKHPLGADIGLDATAMDSGDGNTAHTVYDFVEGKEGQKIFAIKGRLDAPRDLQPSAGRRKGTWRAPLYIVGVGNVKTSLMVALPRKPQEQHSIRFSDSLDENWFSQFASERRVIKYKKGGAPQVAFEVVDRRRQEAWDCSVYAYAIRHQVRFDYAKRYEELKKPLTPEGTPRRSLRELAAAMNRAK